jgi:outer membrane protein
MIWFPARPNTTISTSISTCAAFSRWLAAPRALLATLLACALLVAPFSPVFAQDAAPPATSTQNTSTAASSPVPKISLGLAKHDFTHGPRSFPNLILPYFPIAIEKPDLANSPKLEQLIQDDKLRLTLDDAIALALENNVDIIVARYNPWLAQTDVLRAHGGGGLRGVGSTISTINSSGASTQGPSTSTTASGISNTTSTFSSGAGSSFALGGSPQQFSFDPTIVSTIGYDFRRTPVNNPFLAGTGNSNLFRLTSHTATYNVGVNQSFWTGTSAQVLFNNTRGSSNSPSNLFNPFVESSLAVAVSQQLLNGFGILPNTRNILIAKNNKKIADLQFELQAITTITSTINAYWELVFAIDNVKVQQESVNVSQNLYNNNKKQLEIGTMAPLDVTRAEAELASGNQNLLVAQTAKLQQEQILKGNISKNPADPRLMNVEIIPLDSPTQPAVIEPPTFEQAIQEAFQNRPDLRQQEISLNTAGVNVRATRNGLLPIATLTGSYSSGGLSGNQPIPGPLVFSAGQPIIDAQGKPVTGTNASGAQVPIFVPVVTDTSTGINTNGLSGSLSDVFHNRFPDYSVQLSLQIPLRNRQAQADNQSAILQQRQDEAREQQVKNAILLDVRNTFIALQQNRAGVAAAAKTRELQQQTADAEQKKYSLGASTVYLVIQTQRDLVSARGAELRALINLVEAKANYERAIGRTLDINRVTVADGTSFERDTLIPGTLHGKVIGTENLFPVTPGKVPAPGEVSEQR